MLLELSSRIKEGLLQRIAKLTVGSLISTLFIAGAGVGIGVVGAPVANAAAYTSCYANGDNSTPTKPTITNISYTYSNGASVDLVTITFTPPVNNGTGGSPTEYWYSTDGEVTWKIATWTSPGTTLTFSRKSESNGSLTRSGSYGIGIVARNASGGYGCSSGSLTAVAGTPSAPTSVTAVKGNGQVTLSWVTPSSDGGAAISDYRYQYSTDGGLNWSTSTSIGSITNSYILTGLTNGTSYTFRIAASNSQGTGVFSQNSNVATPSTNPSNPTSLSASVDTRQSTVSWIAGSNGGASIDSYTVVASPGGSSCTTPNGATYSCVVTGLTNGQNYTFTVKAWNINGSSSGVTTTATPVSSSTSAISNVTISPSITLNTGFSSETTTYSATVAYTTSSLSFTPTFTGSYETATVAGNLITSGSSRSVSLSVGSNTVRVIGYAENGFSTTYTFTITRAPLSDVSTLTGLTVTGISLSPSFSPGSLIYSATTTLSSAVVSPTFNGSGETVTVQGLATSTSASQSVSLSIGSNTINVIGYAEDGTTSDYVLTITRLDTTSTLTALSSGAGGLSSFTSGTRNYSTSVAYSVSTTTITATWSGTGETATVTAEGVTSLLTSGVSSSTINLAVGLNRILVKGYSQSGDVTTYTYDVTRQGQAPDAPIIGTATAFSESATVTWSFTGSDGGYAIDSFTVTSNPDGLKCIATGASATNCTVTELTNGQAYTFTVKAYNSQGASGESSASSPAVTPDETPNAPASASASAGTLSFNLVWTAPTGNRASISGYQIDISEDGVWRTLVPNTGSTATSRIITGLSGDVTYQFKVYALNSKGVVGAGRSAGSGVKPSKNSQTITWTSFVTSMVYNETQTVSITSSGTGSATYSVSGPCAISAANKIYATGVGNCVVVSTSNSTPSYSSVTETQTVTIDAGIPDTPTVTTPTSGDGSITISATAASNSGGVSLSHFKYEYKLTSASDIDANWTLVSDTVTVTAGNSANKTISGLANGTSYDIRVTSVNSRSKNSTSVKKTSITPSTTPDAPTTPNILIYTDTATVTWSAPGNNGGATIDSYTVMMKTNAGDFEVLASGVAGTTYTATGLSSSNEYEFLVYASNIRGKGSNSASSGKVQYGKQNQTISLTTADRFNYLEEISTTYSSDAGGAGGTLTLSSDTTEFCVITVDGKIKANKSGTCTVKVNTPGNGSYNSSSKSKTITIDPIEPDDPDTSTVTTTSSSIVVNWTALASTKDGGNGGSGVKGYKFEYSSDSGTSWNTILDTSTALTSTISSLSANTDYKIRLKAINNGNKYSSGREFTVRTSAASKSSRGLGVSGGSTTNYGQTLTLTKSGSSTGSRWQTNDSQVCTVDETGTVTTVGAGTCSISLLADEDSTYESGTATTSFTIEAIDPDAPSLSDPSAGEESLTLSWTAPTNKGGAARISEYTVTSTPSGFGCTTTGATTCTITGLNSSTTYTFTITATSSSGKTSVISSSKSGKPNAKAAAPKSDPAPRFDPAPSTPEAPKEPVKVAPKTTAVLPPVKSAATQAPEVASNGNIITKIDGKDELAVLTIKEVKNVAGTGSSAGSVAASTKAEIKGSDWSMAVLTANAPAAPASGGLEAPAAAKIAFEKGASAQTTGNGFAPRTYISVYLFSDPIMIGKIRTDGFGNFKGTIKIPVDMPIGDHTLQLNGYAKNLEIRTTSLPVTVFAKQTAAKPIPTPSATATTETKAPSITFTINFGMNSWWVDSVGYSVIRAAMKKIPVSATNVTISVIGNVQHTKIDPYPNIGLNRAKAVVKAMRILGVAGKYSASQSDEKGKTSAEYRRADVTITWTN